MSKRIIQVMCAALLFMSTMVSVYAAEDAVYSDDFVKINVDENGKLSRWETFTDFEEIFVTMPDGAMPTYEQLGITNKKITESEFCQISRFDEKRDVDDMYVYKRSGDGFITDDKKAEVSSSAYCIPYYNYMTDDEAIQLIKKLKADKVILSGGLVGHSYDGYFELTTRNGLIFVRIECSDALSEEYITESVRSPINGDEKYYGFADFNNAGFTVESIFASNTSDSNGNKKGHIEYSLNYDKEKYKEQLTLYKDVNEVFDEIKTDNISQIDIKWFNPNFAAYYPKNGIYNVSDKTTLEYMQDEIDFSDSEPVEIVPANAEPTMYGDVTGDNKVNVSDAVYLNMFLLDSEKYTLTDVQKANSDCHKDGVIDSADGTLLMNYLCELIDAEQLGS